MESRDHESKLDPRRGGFTLIEILLVVVIIGILVAVVAPNLAGRVDDARIAATRDGIKALGLALDMYEVDNGRYPSSLAGLISNPGVNNWNGPYIKDGRSPVDAWGNAFQYTAGERGYKIASGGADGSMGGTDDITN